jgi:hypothetical protein
MKQFLLLWFLSVSFCASAQSITTIAGTGISGYSGDGNLATLARMKQPGFIAIDRYNNVYFGDAYNNVVRKVTPLGYITTIAGTGIEGYSGDGGLAINAQFFGPSGVAVDQDDNVFVADCLNMVIRKIAPFGVVTTIAGTGVAGYTGDGGPAVSAKLNRPYALAIDTNGNLFFSDAGNYSVRKIDASGIISTIAGCGIFGDSGEGGPATNAHLKWPGQLAFHPKTGELFFPVDANKKVMKVDASGIISTVAGSGIIGNDGDGGPATAAKMKGPNSICFDTAGNLFISDGFSHVIRKVDTGGIISTIVGTGVGGYNGDGDLLTTRQLNGPNIGPFDKWGNLYISDCYNSRVRKINYNPTTVQDVPYRLSNVRIYPNPAASEVTIVADVVISSLTIKNLLGQEVLTQHPGKKEVTLNIETLPAGVYSITTNGSFAGRVVK